MAWSLNKSSGVDGLVYSGRPLIVVRAISAAARTAIVADTPHREPDVLAEVVAGIQATTIVVQVVLDVAIVRSSRPPVAVGASIEERVIAVAPTKDRRESGGVASNAAHLVKGR